MEKPYSTSTTELSSRMDQAIYISSILWAMERDYPLSKKLWIISSEPTSKMETILCGASPTKLTSPDLSVQKILLSEILMAICVASHLVSAL